MLQTRLLPAPAAKGSTPFPSRPFLPPILERRHRRCGAHLHLRGTPGAWEPPPGRRLPAPEGWSGAATEESRGGGGGQRCTDCEEELGVLVEPATGGAKLALNWQVAPQRSLCGSLPDTLSCAHARAHTCAHTHTHARSAQTPRAHRPSSAQHTRFSLSRKQHLGELSQPAWPSPSRAGGSQRSASPWDLPSCKFVTLFFSFFLSFFLLLFFFNLLNDDGNRNLSVIYKRKSPLQD